MFWHTLAYSGILLHTLAYSCISNSLLETADGAYHCPVGSMWLFFSYLNKLFLWLLAQHFILIVGYIWKHLHWHHLYDLTYRIKPDLDFRPLYWEYYLLLTVGLDCTDIGLDWIGLTFGYGVSTALRTVLWPTPFLTRPKASRSGWLFQSTIPSKVTIAEKA